MFPNLISSFVSIFLRKLGNKNSFGFPHPSTRCRAFPLAKMDSLRDFVLSRRFDAFILFVIIVNTAILTIQRPGETQQRPVRQLESFCTFVFIVELFLKLAGLGISEYFGNVWNRLDFFVVLESIIGIIMVCK